MIIRTSKGAFYQAFSKDHGISWNRPTRTPFLSPNAPGFLTRLESGRLAFVWNLIDEAEASIWKRGEQPTTNQRHRLAIVLSEDDGRSWTLPVIAAQAKEISYPFLLEVAPGQLMLSSGRLRKPDLEMDTVDAFDFRNNTAEAGERNGTSESAMNSVRVKHGKLLPSVCNLTRRCPYWLFSIISISEDFCRFLVSASRWF